MYTGVVTASMATGVTTDKDSLQGLLYARVLYCLEIKTSGRADVRIVCSTAIYLTISSYVIHTSLLIKLSLHPSSDKVVVLSSVVINVIAISKRIT